MRIDAGDADHGGDLDAAARRHGGRRAGWLDLSTGINRVPYPVGRIPPAAWRDLPDAAASAALVTAARAFWQVPAGAEVLAAPGASSLIARIPALTAPGPVSIPAPTYNEHARAFAAAGWTLDPGSRTAQVLVHPNNPDGRLWTATEAGAPFCVIDESFCDVDPRQSLIALAARPRTLVLKSFGKFWGLAGLRLGFAIGDPVLVRRLGALLGPWPVPGAAIAVGTAALGDPVWADRTRARLGRDAARLDQWMQAAGVRVVGGTTLFRLYDTDNAALWQDHLAARQIWTRRFPYSDRWLRMGLPGSRAEWQRLAEALTPGPLA